MHKPKSLWGILLWIKHFLTCNIFYSIRTEL